MNKHATTQERFLVTGSDKLAFSIAANLLLAGHKVDLYTKLKQKAWEMICQHAADMLKFTSKTFVLDDLAIKSELDEVTEYRLAIIITKENLLHKQAAIKKLEYVLPENTLIAINTESLLLSDIQQEAKNPQRIIGANWVEPAHTTYFLEIISNQVNSDALVEEFSSWARQYWNKDPYVLKAGYSIRGRMMSALIREAFYLVENGFVSFEDVDRACRNDAGYYLPFAGNFRYMDLMGTYIYGLVMKDMNPDLSKDRHIPAFFNKILDSGGRGMETNKGFYDYKNGDLAKWKELSRVFSYQIQEIIEKYPFNYLEKKLQPEVSLVL